MTLLLFFVIVRFDYGELSEGNIMLLEIEMDADGKSDIGFSLSKGERLNVRLSLFSIYCKFIRDKLSIPFHVPIFSSPREYQFQILDLKIPLFYLIFAFIGKETR